MKCNRLFLLLLFFTQLITSAGAQSLLGLNYPMGIPARSGSSSSLSFGGAGAGVKNEYFGFSNNPANLGTIGRTIFSYTLNSNTIFLNDGKNSTRHLDMSTSGISLSIPFSRWGALGISIEPAGNFLSSFRKTIPINSITALSNVIQESTLFSADSLEMGIRQNGKSLSWQVAWGYHLLKKIYIGAGIKRFNLNKTATEVMKIHGSMNNRLIDSTALSFSTNALRGGLLFPLGELCLGFSGEYYFVNEATATHIVEGTRDTISTTWESRYDFKPPPSFTFGLSYQFNQYVLTVFDAGMTLWNRFYSEELTKNSMDNAFHLSGGIQYIPAPNQMTPKFYEITQYRVGFRYTELPGAQGSEIAVTLAAGLPIKINRGIVDVVLEAAQRKDHDFDNYRENIIGIKLGLNSGSKWNQ